MKITALSLLLTSTSVLARPASDPSRFDNPRILMADGTIATPISIPAFNISTPPTTESATSAPISGSGHTFSTPTDFYATDYSSNWAGAVQKSPPTGSTFSSVSATWVLPSLKPPTSGNGQWSTAEWVGIDGYTYQNDILQAGTLSTVTVSNGQTTQSSYFWYEYYPNPLTSFALPVQAGHNVHVEVRAQSATTGVVIVDNLTTGQSQAILIAAPSSSAAIGGQNAEWIVEDVATGSGLVPFANFGQVTMQNCIAVTNTGKLVTLANSTVVNMLQNNAVVATPTIQSSGQQMLVKYTGPTAAARATVNIGLGSDDGDASVTIGN